MRNNLLGESWKQEDEDLRQKRILRSERAKSQIEEETFTRIQSDIMDRMHRLHLQRDSKVMEIERSRAVRLAREQADEAADIADRAQIMHQKGALLRSTQESAKIAEDGLSASQVSHPGSTSTPELSQLNQDFYPRNISWRR